MNRAVQDPYPSSRQCRFTIGHDPSGRWLVCDRFGRVGGLFADRASAVHFAMEECNRDPGQICCLSDDQALSPNAIFETKPAPKTIGWSTKRAA